MHSIVGNCFNFAPRLATTGGLVSVVSVSVVLMATIGSQLLSYIMRFNLLFNVMKLAVGVLLRWVQWYHYAPQLLLHVTVRFVTRAFICYAHYGFFSTCMPIFGDLSQCCRTPTQRGHRCCETKSRCLFGMIRVWGHIWIGMECGVSNFSLPLFLM